MTIPQGRPHLVASGGHLLDPQAQVPGLDAIATVSDPFDETPEFWSTTATLSKVLQFARARRVGPYSLLGVSLGIAASTIPPGVVLPPERGSYASLNLYVGLAGPSGTNKTTSIQAARELVVTDPPTKTVKPGSGEGLAHKFAKVDKQGQQIGLEWSVVASIPEIETMLKTAERSGATLMGEWRSGWSGERLGQDYRGPTNTIVLQDHRYRLVYVLGIQPTAAELLFKATDLGTPQRILWMPCGDPDCPDVPPDPPQGLKIPSWPGIDHDALRNLSTSMRHRRAVFTELPPRCRLVC
jgi:hypothetical protein